MRQSLFGKVVFLYTVKSLLTPFIEGSSVLNSREKLSSFHTDRKKNKGTVQCSLLPILKTIGVGTKMDNIQILLKFRIEAQILVIFWTIDISLSLEVTASTCDRNAPV